MLTNANVTIINQWGNKYYAIPFRAVSLVTKAIRTATEKGLVSADTATLRIPIDSVTVEYLTPEQWKSLEAKPIQTTLTTESLATLTTEAGEPLTDELNSFWTLIPQKTYVLNRLIEAQEIDSITTLMTKEKVLTVYSVGDNRRGSLQHWRCDCK